MPCRYRRREAREESQRPATRYAAGQTGKRPPPEAIGRPARRTSSSGAARRGEDGVARLEGQITLCRGGFEEQGLVGVVHAYGKKWAGEPAVLRVFLSQPEGRAHRLTNTRPIPLLLLVVGLASPTRVLLADLVVVVLTEAGVVQTGPSMKAMVSGMSVCWRCRAAHAA